MAREGRSCDARQLSPPTGCDGSQPSTSEAAFVIGEKGSPSNTQALLARQRPSAMLPRVLQIARGVKGATSGLPGFPAAIATRLELRSLPPGRPPRRRPGSAPASFQKPVDNRLQYLSKGNPTVTIAKSAPALPLLIKQRPSFVDALLPVVRVARDCGLERRRRALCAGAARLENGACCHAMCYTAALAAEAVAVFLGGDLSFVGSGAIN